MGFLPGPALARMASIWRHRLWRIPSASRSSLHRGRKYSRPTITYLRLQRSQLVSSWAVSYVEILPSSRSQERMSRTVCSTTSYSLWSPVASRMKQAPIIILPQYSPLQPPSLSAPGALNWEVNRVHRSLSRSWWSRMKPTALACGLSMCLMEKTDGLLITSGLARASPISTCMPETSFSPAMIPYTLRAFRPSHNCHFLVGKKLKLSTGRGMFK